MKICFITDNIFSLGGVQRVVSVLANEMAKTYEVDILCLSDNYTIDRKLYNLNKNINVDINRSLLNKNLVAKIYGKIGRIINDKTGVLNNKKFIDILAEIYFPNQVKKKIISYINDKKYDIVIGVEGVFSILLGMISEFITAKTIGWQHNSYDAYFKTYKKYYWNQDELFRYYINKLDKYIVLTEHDKERMKKHLNIDSKRIYNPLSFTSKEKSKCSNSNILFVGRLVEEQKGLDLLVKSFKIISENNEQCMLTIVGDGPDKGKIQHLVESLAIQNKVNIIPFTDHVQKFYLDASVFVSSSRWEGFGLVVTEAMECGLPVVSFNNSGPSEIINKDGENGILVENGNIDLLAKSILNLINDRQRLRCISSNSISRAKDFNIEIIKKQWDETILDLIKN